jgi:hypothetical protein
MNKLRDQLSAQDLTPMALECIWCTDWREQIAKVNGPIEMQAIRSGFRHQYDGKPFKFCPWCGQELHEVACKDETVKSHL